MQKYKRSMRYAGRRAWFKKFALPLKLGKPAWHGNRPNSTNGSTIEAFGPSDKKITVKTTDDFKRIEIKLNNPNLKLFMSYKPGECFFTGINYTENVWYRSVSYETRQRALDYYSRGMLKWVLVGTLQARGR
jgi:hypothetical protein